MRRIERASLAFAGVMLASSVAWADPPVYRPQAQQAPHDVEVSVDSDKPGTYLEALSTHPEWIAFRHRWHTDVVYGARFVWEPVCVAPCTMEVPSDAVYRVAGRTVTPSDAFVLHDSQKLHVEGGARGRHAGGGIALGLGIPALLVGIILVAVSDETRTAGYIVGGSGLGLTALGAILLTTSETTVHDDAGREVAAGSRTPKLAIGPKGLVF